MGNSKDMENRKEKKINKIKEQLEKLRAKLQVDGTKPQHPKLKPELQKTRSKPTLSEMAAMTLRVSIFILLLSLF